MAILNPEFVKLTSPPEFLRACELIEYLAGLPDPRPSTHTDTCEYTLVFPSACASEPDEIRRAATVPGI